MRFAYGTFLLFKSSMAFFLLNSTTTTQEITSNQPLQITTETKEKITAQKMPQLVKNTEKSNFDSFEVGSGLAGSRQKLNVDRMGFLENKEDVIEAMARPFALFVMAILTLFCLGANSLTVVILFKHQPLQKSVSNLYILSLSMADTLVGLFVMPIMAINEIFKGPNREFFGPVWLCEFWKVSDLLLCTISLYSICAIAFDRVWNLEKPLRVFKRSRKIAKRIILSIWIGPCLFWCIVPILAAQYFSKASTSIAKRSGECLLAREVENSYMPIISIPILYIPAITLIGMFIRISMVIHRHLKFVRENSSLPQMNQSTTPPPSPIPTPAFLNFNKSKNSINDSPTYTNPLTKSHLKTPELNGNNFYDSLTSVNSGCYNSVFRAAQNSSPHQQRNGINNPAIVTVETPSTPMNDCINDSAEFSLDNADSPQHKATIRKYPLHTSLKTNSSPAKKSGLTVLYNGTSKLCRSESNNLEVSSKSHFYPQSQSYHSRSRLGSGDSFYTNSPTTTPVRLLRKFSAISRNSGRFSVIAIPGNLVEILQREGVTRQMKAAKAVGLISLSFLLCWFPFLISWPIKVYGTHLIPAYLYRVFIWLNYLCSTLNPLLYVLNSPRVQMAIKNYVYKVEACGFYFKLHKAESKKSTALL